MPEQRILKKLAIPQKSRRKFTFYYEESAATSNFLSCCLVDNVFLHTGVRTEYVEKNRSDTGF